MEPWEFEQIHQWQLQRQWESMPLCAFCAEPIRSERCLSLEGFGLEGLVCERCVEGNMQFTQPVG